MQPTMNQSAVDAIAAAIKVQEGWGPGSLSQRNNNPGNLVYVGQAGAVAGEGGFAKYPTEAAGDAAEKYQINLDASRGFDAAGHPVVTVADLISSWAPASDVRNNTPAYVASVESQTGFARDAVLNDLGAAGGALLPEVAVGAGWLDTITVSSLGGGGIDAQQIAIGLGAALAVWLLSRVFL